MDPIRPHSFELEGDLGRGLAIQPMTLETAFASGFRCPCKPSSRVSAKAASSALTCGECGVRISHDFEPGDMYSTIFIGHERLSVLSLWLWHMPLVDSESITVAGACTSFGRSHASNASDFDTDQSRVSLSATRRSQMPKPHLQQMQGN